MKVKKLQKMSSFALFVNTTVVRKLTDNSFMKETIIFILLCLTTKLSISQTAVSKDSLDTIFKETLQKARNAVSDATNNWRYDNSKDDYFKKDTLTFNTARAYRMNYCNGVNWSFNKEKQFILEFAQYCNEPPTKRISKREDYMRLEIERRSNKSYLNIKNANGLFETFEVLELTRNQPLSEGENAFDYTMVLVRLK